MEGLTHLQGSRTVSLTRARQLLPGSRLTDAELDVLIEQLEALADIFHSTAKERLRKGLGDPHASFKA